MEAYESTVGSSNDRISAFDDCDNLSCPICLDSTETCGHLIHGKHCNHGFCRACLNRLLFVHMSDDESVMSHQQEHAYLHAVQQQESSQSLGEVAVRGVPTQGICPLCRSRLSLFDLVYSSLTPPKSCAGADTSSPTVESASRGAIDNVANVAYSDEIQTDWRKTPLRGRIFVPTLSGIGFGSFHFDTAVTSDDDEDGMDDLSAAGEQQNGERFPYYNTERTTCLLNMACRNDLVHVQYHAPSHTMYAEISVRSKLYEKWLAILCFSSADLQCLRTGAIVKIWNKDAHLFSAMDGTWAVEQYPLGVTHSAASLPRAQRRESRVEGGLVIGGHINFRVLPNVSENNIVISASSNLSYVLLCTSWDWEQRPHGPNEGDVILWRDARNDRPFGDNASDNTQSSSSSMIRERWTLIRKSREMPPIEVQYIGCYTGHGYRQYDDRDRSLSEITSSMRYIGSQMWGNVFFQATTVGLASYHFQDADSSYISYEHPRTSRWGPLDNGAPIPPRVRFRNVSFDAATRIFRGSIHWQNDFGTTWQGISQWIYEIQFDTQFTCIIAGQVHSVSNRNDELLEMSRFGENLVYVNASLPHHFDQLMDTYDSTTIRAALQRHSAVLRERLEVEGASERTVAVVNQILYAAGTRPL